MADGVAITAGTGTTILTDDTGAGGHAQVMKLAISTDGSGTLVPADDTNGLRVTPSSRMVTVSATPAMTAASYITGEQIGAVTTFTGAALATGRSGAIMSAVMTSSLANTVIPNLDLFLFEVSPTLVGGNDAAFDITDANLVTARCCCVFNFLGTNYRLLANNTVCIGSVGGASTPAVPFVTATTANLFGVLVSRATFTGASNANVVTLRIVQD